MKIAIIARNLSMGGVTRYIENMVKEFSDIKFEKFDIFLFTDDKKYTGMFKNTKVVYLKNRSILFWDYLKLPFAIRKYNIDTILYPKNIIPITHLLLKSNKIIIIHDLAHFVKGLKAYKIIDSLYMKILMGFSCKIADRIIAVSKSTKSDIVNILKVSEAKIDVIYEGVENKFKRNNNQYFVERTLNKFRIKRPFLFYCGSISPRKNLLRVLQAFQKVKNIIPHNIYLTGSNFWGETEIRNYIKKELADRVIILGSVNEEELINLYSSADAYIYPSLYEGFGLPILEAQACGCPVLTSNITSCPEVAGKAACFVNPYSIDDIKDGILKILDDERYRELLIKDGYENIKRFSWRKSTNSILKLCQGI